MNTNSYRAAVNLTVACVLLAAWYSHGWSEPATAPATIDVALLRASAIGDDFDKSMAALQQLSAAGSRASQALGEVVPQLLARDAATIESETPVINAQWLKLRPVETDVQTLRAQALTTIETLTLDPQSLKGAHRNYARLSNTAARLTPVYAKQMHIIQALSRRAQCVSMAPAGKAVSPAESNRLANLAKQALGISAESAQKFLAGPLDPPADPAGRRLWFYVSCRRIEAWNRVVEPAMNAAEAIHFRRINSYRELLGLLPYEMDPRLVQSARRHSKEMMDLWYFSHYSPTLSERGPGDRMVRAGYADGSNENITMGSWTGEDAFWQLFDSPDHHRAWVSRDDTTLGVGKWENAWTEDIGAGHRLVTASAAERAATVVQGAELKPQLAEKTRQHPRDLATIKFYDESGQEVKQMPATVEKKVSTRER